MAEKFTIHVNEKISARFNQDSFVEVLHDILGYMALSEISEILDLQWNSNKTNSRLAQNIILMTVGEWVISTL